jgi:hypothetical protein
VICGFHFYWQFILPLTIDKESTLISDDNKKGIVSPEIKLAGA